MLRHKLLKRLAPYKGYIALIISSLAFSLMSVCIKKLGEKIPIYEIVFARALISLILTRYMLYNKGIYPWGINKKLLLIRGLLGSGALFCIFKAISTLPLATATVIQYTYPTFIALTACIFLKEKIDKNIILALITGLTGIILVVQPKWINKEAAIIPFYFILIAIAGALLTALAYLCVKKLSESENNLVIIYYFPLISVPLTIPFLINNTVLPMGKEWLLIVGVGIFTQIGQIYITKGLRIINAARAGSINYIQVLFAAIWGIIFFSEPVNQYVAIGGLFVLLSIIISISTINSKTKTHNPIQSIRT
tara:strand:+ start:490 stop:1413 length:924 start_codon:yes stop_codon:yes gene_type:complete